MSRELVRRKEVRSAGYSFGSCLIFLTFFSKLATIYLMCRALLVVMRSMSRDGLDERYGDQLEATFFEEFICDPDM